MIHPAEGCGKEINFLRETCFRICLAELISGSAPASLWIRAASEPCGLVSNWEILQVERVVEGVISRTLLYARRRESRSSLPGEIRGGWCRYWVLPFRGHPACSASSTDRSRGTIRHAEPA